VIYHGAREWTVPLSFGETMAADPVLRPYLARFYLLSARSGSGAGRTALQPKRGARRAAGTEVQLSGGQSAGEMLVGTGEWMTFHNAETGFCVLRVQVRGRRDLTTVVGRVAAIAPGERI
jgi:hypothetical protein